MSQPPSDPGLSGPPLPSPPPAAGVPKGAPDTPSRPIATPGDQIHRPQSPAVPSSRLHSSVGAATTNSAVPHNPRAHHPLGSIPPASPQTPVPQAPQTRPRRKRKAEAMDDADSDDEPPQPIRRKIAPAPVVPAAPEPVTVGDLRSNAVEDEQKKIIAHLSQRELALKELLYVEALGCDLSEFNENYPELVNTLEDYHRNHPLFPPKERYRRAGGSAVPVPGYSKVASLVPPLTPTRSGQHPPEKRGVGRPRILPAQPATFTEPPDNYEYNSHSIRPIVTGIVVPPAPPGPTRKKFYPFTDLDLLEQRDNMLQPPNLLDVPDIKERAKDDAKVITQMSSLHRLGALGTKRIAKAPEPPRASTHWDYVMKEMAWLATDFKEERKSKMANAKKLARAVVKFHQDRERELLQEQKEKEQLKKERARWITRQVKTFWREVEDFIRLKHKSVLDLKKKEALDKHLEFLVDQTEKYTEKVAQNLKASAPPTPTAPPNSLRASSVSIEEKIPEVPSFEANLKQLLEEEASSATTEASAGSTVATTSTASTAQPGEDEEFDPSKQPTHIPAEDDESTIADAEKLLAVDDPDVLPVKEEIDTLQKESELPLEEILTRYRSNAESTVVTDAEEGEEGSEDEDEEDEPDAFMDVKAGDGTDSNLNDKARLEAASAAAQAAQPTGFTLNTTSVKTPVPFLVRGSLREYQHIGLDWLVTMYEKKLNGILADEMGLGKTVMTISLLAHLATQGKWGPHLIIVPASVLLNWEMELKRWCPSFKILTYFGSLKERKQKRVGWTKPNAFHVCLTTYKLATQDSYIFKRKHWFYMILDEAHNIKNYKSQRWQTLLNYRTRRRLLLTGTPLQNDLMELWALMHFLMPHIFSSHSEFKDWFSNPLNNMLEGTSNFNEDLIQRLHTILRPFILRRLKKDVEKQMPGKHEHVVMVKLSKRQRFLYDEFMSSRRTQNMLTSGNYLGIANVLMQLRKVCNHPDLFEARPIVSPFDQRPLKFVVPSRATKLTDHNPDTHISLDLFNFHQANYESQVSHLTAVSTVRYKASKEQFDQLADQATKQPLLKHNRTRVYNLYKPAIRVPSELFTQITEDIKAVKAQSASSHGALAFLKNVDAATYSGPLAELIYPASASGPREVSGFAQAQRQKREQKRRTEVFERLNQYAFVNELRCQRMPIYGQTLLSMLRFNQPIAEIHLLATDSRRYFDYPSALLSVIKTAENRAEEELETIQKFVCYIPSARAPPLELLCSHPNPSVVNERMQLKAQVWDSTISKFDTLHPSHIRTQIYFPDKRLLQYDCGKLQSLAVLLRNLKKDGHRALIFTQMTRMLDVLEEFINLHGYTYLRLDGATRIDRRQMLMERFNKDPKIFLFILTTRTGGVGINLTGADTVIFYDSDWNPAMDAQAQDRCHRIGQTREVHIYRLTSERTIEENILKKARQKLMLDQIIKEGNFTTDFLKSVEPMRDFISEARKELAIGGTATTTTTTSTSAPVDVTDKELENAFLAAEDEADVQALKSVRQELATEGREDEMEEEGAQGALPASLADDPMASQFLHVQRYAIRFLEEVNPVVDKEEFEEAHRTIEAEEATWQADALARMQAGQESSEEESDVEVPRQPNLALDSEDDQMDLDEPRTPVSVPTPAKRGRGRPPRNASKPPVATTTTTTTTRNVGSSSSNVPVKRGRGRPRKNPIVPTPALVRSDEEDSVENGVAQQSSSEEDVPLFYSVQSNKEEMRKVYPTATRNSSLPPLLRPMHQFREEVAAFASQRHSFTTPTPPEANGKALPLRRSTRHISKLQSANPTVVDSNGVTWLGAKSADVPAIFGALFPENEDLYVPPGETLDSLLAVLQELENIENDLTAQKQLRARQASAVTAVQEQMTQQKLLDEHLGNLSDRYSTRKPDTLGAAPPPSLPIHWTEEEDDAIEQAIDEHGTNFALVASILNNVDSRHQRTASQVFEHWRERLLPQRVSTLKSTPTLQNSTSTEHTPHGEGLVGLLRTYLEARRPLAGSLGTTPLNFLSPRPVIQTNTLPDTSVATPTPKYTDPLALIQHRRTQEPKPPTQIGQGAPAAEKPSETPLPLTDTSLLAQSLH